MVVVPWLAGEAGPWPTGRECSWGRENLIKPASRQGCPL